MKPVKFSRSRKWTTHLILSSALMTSLQFFVGTQANALDQGLNPTFGPPTRTADGFSVSINNFDPNYTWATPAVTAGSVSTTLGISWSTRSNSSGSRVWLSIASSSDGTKLAAVENVGYVYTSTDSGATWSQQIGSGSRAWRSIASSSDGTKLAAVVSGDSGGYIYTSTNSGATWTEQTNSGSKTWRSIVSSSDGTKLAAVVLNGYIYTSIDSGATWSQRTVPGSREWRSIASSSDGTKLAAVANRGYIYTSTDSGATWIQRTGAASWRWIASSSDGTKLAAAGSPGRIYTSTDSGATWSQQIVAGSSEWRSIASNSDGTKLAAVEETGYIHTTTDSGATWSKQIVAGSREWRSIASNSDGTKLAAVALNGYIYTWTPTFLTVSGLTPGASATITQTTSRVGYTSGSATVAGSALAIAVPDQAAIAAAAAAREAEKQEAAAAREAEKQEARANIINNLKSAKDLSVDLFTKAEIPGITPGNIAAVQAELLALPETSRNDIKQVLKVARKYEVVGKIGSDQVNYLYSNSFVEIGLIPATSKNKVALVSVIRKLSESARDSYSEIKAAIDAETVSIQARRDRLAKVLARSSTRYTK